MTLFCIVVCGCEKIAGARTFQCTNLKIKMFIKEKMDALPQEVKQEAEKIDELPNKGISICNNQTNTININKKKKIVCNRLVYEIVT